MNNGELLGEIPTGNTSLSIILVTVGVFFIWSESTQLLIGFALIGAGIIAAIVDWIFNLRFKHARTNLINHQIAEEQEEPEGAEALPKNEQIDERSRIDYDEFNNLENEVE